MKVSIILPTFNGALYINKSVDSILNQDFEDFELIVVDDASTDNTPVILKEYKKRDERIRVLHNNRNKKLPRSLNIGFHQAKGEYFTWTSDDNFYRNDAIKKMVKVLDEHKEVDIVYCKYFIIDEKDKIIGSSVLNKPSMLYIKNCIGACFMYRRNVHEVLRGFDINKFLFEDYDFWLRAYDYGFNFYGINENLYYYRLHKNSLTEQRKKEIDKVTKLLLKQNVKKVKSYQLKSKILQEIEKREENCIIKFFYNVKLIVYKKKIIGR